MAKWFVQLLFVAFLAAVNHHDAAAARVLPAGANGLNDEKNVVTFSGVGSYAGLGPNGIPFGGIGGGVGAGGDIGGTRGFSGVGAVIGTGPNGNGISGIGSFPGGGVGGFPGVGGIPGGGGVGSIPGGGTGALPFP